MLVRGYGEKCLSSCDEKISASGDDLRGGNFVSLAGQRGHSDTSSPFSDGLPHSPSHRTSSDSSRGTSTWDSEKSSQKNRTTPSYAGEQPSMIWQIFSTVELLLWRFCFFLIFDFGTPLSTSNNIFVSVLACVPYCDNFKFSICKFLSCF
jgi:hypothetical protein